MTDSETTTVIPAEPGYQVIELLEGGEVFKTPIIAWRIDVCVMNDMRFVYTKPVTIESDEEDANRSVLAPDGRVHFDDCTFLNVHEWKQYVLEERAKLAEVRKSVQAEMSKNKTTV